MPDKPIMVVSLNVPAEKEAEFNAFYHHRFLPAVLSDSKAIVGIKRYEETGIAATLRWHDKAYLTIYEIASDEAIADADKAFASPALVDLVREFQQWKNNHLRKFRRMIYKNSWEHERKNPDGAFAGRPLMVWSHEMKPELDAEFQYWYENDYLPKQIADVPSWSAIRRYASVGQQAMRRLTVFEAADEPRLRECIELLRSPHRVWENFEWQRKVEAAVVWQELASFRPVYRLPG